MHPFARRRRLKKKKGSEFKSLERFVQVRGLRGGGPIEAGGAGGSAEGEDWCVFCNVVGENNGVWRCHPAVW